MKKVFLCICVAAIVALATVNLSLAFKNEAKVANLTLSGTESLAKGEGGEGEGDLWVRQDEDCIYEFYVGVGVVFKMFGIPIKGNGEGWAIYKYPGGKTHCTAGGQEQCEARYCPPFSVD